MSNKVIPVIKTEPIDPDEQQPLDKTPSCSNVITSPACSAPPKKKMKTKTEIAKKIKEEPSEHHKEKVKAAVTVEEPYVEPPRPGVIPDRTMSDFYCKVCNAHMNSVQVWESHIKCKRHLKNLKKDSTDGYPVKQEKPDVDDVDDLYYIDAHGAPSPSGSSKMCEGELAREDDRRRNSYSPPPRPSSHSVLPTSSHSASAHSVSPTSSHSASAGPDIDEMTVQEKIDMLKELSLSVHPENEDDMDAMRDIIGLTSQKILQFEIRQLPISMQQKMAGRLFHRK